MYKIFFALWVLAGIPATAFTQQKQDMDKNRRTLFVGEEPERISCRDETLSWEKEEFGYSLELEAGKAYEFVF